MEIRECPERFFLPCQGWNWIRRWGDKGTGRQGDKEIKR
jgi:hypothetical protein